jgi:hypothetical protein
MKRILAAALLAALSLGAPTLIGCSDSTGPEADGPGRIQLNLIDAPGDYDQVNVHVIRVEVHRSDTGDTNDPGGWSVISEDTMMVDRLTLTGGNGLVLADTLLPAGNYTQIRLILGEGNTVMVDSVLHDLEVPSSMNTGIKLIHGFSIEPEALYRATLDWDAQKSVHRTGNGQYKMKPTIRVVVDRISGGLQGQVLPIEARAMIWTLAGADTVTVWADTLTGAFGFPLLEQGTYDLNIGATVGAYRDTVLSGVGVTAGQVTDVGTVTLEAE